MKIKCNIYWATIWQLAIVLLLLWLTRFAFYYYNADVIGTISFTRLLTLAVKGIPFDLSAIAYANALFIAMRVLPFKFTMKRCWRISEFAVYSICNSVLLIIQIGDIPFFRFNGSRLRLDGFLSLLNHQNMEIALSFAKEYWWTFLGIAGVIILLMWLYARFAIKGRPKTVRSRTVLFLAAVAALFLGMRGNLWGHPLSLHTAADVVDKPAEICVVLNTPFSIMRTSNGSMSLPDINYFSEAELVKLRSSLQQPYLPLEADSIRQATEGKNIILIVLESGAQLWLDSLSITPEAPSHGLMPFLDSIASRSIAIRNTICTSNRSMFGQLAILGAVPYIRTMEWAASPYAAMTFDSMPALLAKEGYDTRFFIGADPILQHMGALTKQMGFNKIYCLDNLDIPHEGNTNRWGIYDHIMAKFVAQEMTKADTPFMGSWMTLDLHGPYELPDFWADYGHQPAETSLQRAVQYTDYSLKQFFDMAAQQPWFENTLFVITGDHGERGLSAPNFNSPFIYTHLTFILYAPDGSLKPAKYAEPVMSQIDIPATILWLAGYNKPYISVGTNWFDTIKPHYGIYFRDEQLNVISTNYVVQTSLDALDIVNVFDIKSDPAMLNPIADYNTQEVDDMLVWLRAFLQDYTTRLNTNHMTIEYEN